MHAAVHLVLRDADPDGIVTATRDNWTGKAFSMPIADFAQMRELLGGAGVYVLVGEDEEADDAIPVVYIGEAEAVRERLRPGHHQLTRTDVVWRRVVIFTSQAEDLHKGHVRWLESALVARAREAARARVMNGPTPASPRLPEFDEVFVGAFLANMLVLYPLLGVEAFALPRQRAATATDDDPDTTAVLERLELMLGGEVVATGAYRSGSFILKAGSRVRVAETESAGAHPAGLRRLWKENGTTVAHDGEWMKLLRDVEVSSPSTAARAVLGRSASGPETWVADGVKLRDLVAAQASAPAAP
jgi:hypothetical protein